LLRKGRHPVEHLVDLANDVPAVDDERSLLRHAERDVERGPVLGRVDAVPPEHRVTPLGDAALVGEREQEGDGLGRDAMLREVRLDPRRLEREPLDAGAVRREQVAQVEVDDRRVMTGERLPGGGFHERVGHLVRRVGATFVE